MSGTTSDFHNISEQQGITVASLFTLVNQATTDVQNKILAMQNSTSNVSIGDMFQMQMLMNHLSQLSEMSTNVISASNTAIMSNARNLK